MTTIVQTSFTPWTSLGGGILIGISAIMVMGLFGKIAGIAGITQGALALPGAPRDKGWRIAFMMGLMAAPLLVLGFGGTIIQTVPQDMTAMAVAGILVGTGTALGSGCTSGHGVCGLARLSSRSLAAVATFMAAGFITVFALRHLMGGL